ncbi:hypothetical protein [Massilia sp. YIM B04103]|uniref:hypothetical protein n=1 Tax=Massilia sp. YIM B04103 TaxID=2963106 RepID=UPI002108B8B7|nr:hypothetical protein [Massilia sp. YIM B04103]
MKHIEEMIAKLEAVDWIESPRQATNNELAYAGAYLHLFANYVNANKTSLPESVHPFSSPLKVIGIERSLLNSEILERCERLVSQSSNAYDGVYAKNALEWAALCDAQHPASNGRESLFNPLVELVVSRVPAIIRQGNWVVGENIFPLQNWVDRYSKV